MKRRGNRRHAPPPEPVGDAVLRRRVLGRWARSDSGRITLVFRNGGRLTGTGLWAASPGTDEVAAGLAGAPFAGRWEIRGGWLILSVGRGVAGLRIDMPDEDTVRLFDAPERIGQAYVYRRPGTGAGPTGRTRRSP